MLTKHSTLLRQISMALTVSLVVTIILVLYIDRLPPVAFEGHIASKDIRASQNHEIIDTKATNDLQEKATQQIMPVYNFDATIAIEKRKKIQQSFSAARKQIALFMRRTGKVKQLTESQEDALHQNFLANLGVNLSDTLYDTLRKDNFSEEMERSLSALTENMQKRIIVFDRTEILPYKGVGLALRTINTETLEEREETIRDVASILDLESVREIYARDDASVLQRRFNLDFIDASLFQTALTIAPDLLQPNLILDKAATLARIEDARSAVQNVTYKLQKGQTIIRRGDRFEKRHVTILNGIRSSHMQRNTTLKFLGVFLLVLSALTIIYTFAQKTFKTFKPTQTDLYFLGLSLASFLLILRFGSFLASNLQGTLPFASDMTTFYFLIPIAAGPMLVRFVLNPVITLVFAILLSVFCGFFLEQNFDMTVYYLLSGLFGAWLIGQLETRSSVLKRGVFLGLANTGLVLCLTLINTLSTSAFVDPQIILANCAFAFLAGPFAALVVLGLSPLAESLFGYTTNIKLIELANMNHPLLREMIVVAPGTYLHSQLVGTLAETGMRQIGGNALLARVGSYYHDIGKLKKPDYFIENQKGENYHDSLTSSMSALVIDAHVKDGLDLAHEHKLPAAIIRFISEHQGTKLMTFFYNKALREAEEQGTTVDENDFRYKGPKPQSRESGVVMLADAIEAAVRALEDKAPQKIRSQVEKLVNEMFADGQLNECDLTLKDLHELVDVFTTILSSIHHQRVDYSADNPKPHNHEDEHPPHRQQTPQKSNVAPLFKKNRRTSA